MTKLIAVVILLAVLYGGWELFFYWEKVKNEQETQQKQAAAAIVVGEQLEGMPTQMEPSLKAAESQGATGLSNWLKAFGGSIKDPRKAWIELDYVLLLTRENPQEAKRIFADVKDRTLPNSPVWPRIQAMQKTYE